MTTRRTRRYSMVRGSAIRVTRLDSCGAIETPTTYAAAKCIASVTIDEVVDEGQNVRDRNDEDELVFVSDARTETLGYTVDINFLAVDPGLFHLVAQVPLVYKKTLPTDIIGYDSAVKLPSASFALEVWSKLGTRCGPNGPEWGYTLFPFLKGGRISGFTVENRTINFTLRGARTCPGSKWGVGPYDVAEPGKILGLGDPVTAQTMWRTIITTAPPPPDERGYDTFIDGGYAGVTSDDVIDNFFAPANTQIPGYIDGGNAA